MILSCRLIKIHLKTHKISVERRIKYHGTYSRISLIAFWFPAWRLTD